MQLGDILNKLEKVKRLQNGEWQACCPSHPDRKPSLNLKQDGNKLLIKCQAGCETDKVLSSIGLTMADLFISEAKKVEPSKIVATYDYLDENKNLLFQVVRYEPKSFRQRHRNGSGQWAWNLDNVRRVLYHLPDIVAAAPGDTWYIVEGEKDADNLWAWGYLATTSPGGANAWKDEYAESLKGKRVVVIPDKDAAGYAYAKQVVKSLQGKAISIRVIILPDEKAKDVSDWLDTGHHPDELAALSEDVAVLWEADRIRYQHEDDAISWTKQVSSQALVFRAQNITQERTGIHARIFVKAGESVLSWSYLNIERREDRSSLATAAHSSIKGDLANAYGKDDLRYDLDNFCAGLWSFHVARFKAEELIADENTPPISFLLKPYIVEGGGTILFAPPGRGKSFTLLLWAVSIDAGLNTVWPCQRRRVLFINLERSAISVKRRLGAVNVALGLPRQRPLLAINARGRSLNDIIAACRKDVKQHDVGLIALDSISRAGYGDLNENRPVNAIIDALSSMCQTWLALAHTPRQNEEHIFGGIHFDAGADVCVQLSSQILGNGTLGVGWEIVKQNDIGKFRQEIFALEFGDNGLTTFRRARAFEFPEVEGKRKKDMEQTIMDFVLDRDTGDATATEAATATGFDRANISRYFSESGKFVLTRRVKQSKYYGVKNISDS